MASVSRYSNQNKKYFSQKRLKGCKAEIKVSCVSLVEQENAPTCLSPNQNLQNSNSHTRFSQLKMKPGYFSTYQRPHLAATQVSQLRQKFRTYRKSMGNFRDFLTYVGSDCQENLEVKEKSHLRSKSGGLDFQSPKFGGVSQAHTLREIGTEKIDSIKEAFRNFANTHKTLAMAKRKPPKNVKYLGYIYSLR